MPASGREALVEVPRGSSCRCPCRSHRASCALTVDGLTHASSVIPLDRCSDAASGIVTSALVPLNCSALPYLPAVAQVAFVIVPVVAVPRRVGDRRPRPLIKPIRRHQRGRVSGSRPATPRSPSVAAPLLGDDLQWRGTCDLSTGRVRAIEKPCASVLGPPQSCARGAMILSDADGLVAFPWRSARVRDTSTRQAIRWPPVLRWRFVFRRVGSLPDRRACRRRSRCGTRSESNTLNSGEGRSSAERSEWRAVVSRAIRVRALPLAVASAGSARRPLAHAAVAVKIVAIV